jgi:hypothetical protein
VFEFSVGSLGQPQSQALANRPWEQFSTLSLATASYLDLVEQYLRRPGSRAISAWDETHQGWLLGSLIKTFPWIHLKNLSPPNAKFSNIFKSDARKRFDLRGKGNVLVLSPSALDLASPTFATGSSSISPPNLETRLPLQVAPRTQDQHSSAARGLLPRQPLRSLSSFQPQPSPLQFSVSMSSEPKLVLQQQQTVTVAGFGVGFGAALEGGAGHGAVSRVVFSEPRTDSSLQTSCGAGAAQVQPSITVQKPLSLSSWDEYKPPAASQHGQYPCPSATALGGGGGGNRHFEIIARGGLNLSMWPDEGGGDGEQGTGAHCSYCKRAHEPGQHDPGILIMCKLCGHPHAFGQHRKKSGDAERERKYSEAAESPSPEESSAYADFGPNPFCKGCNTYHAPGQHGAADIYCKHCKVSHRFGEHLYPFSREHINPSSRGTHGAPRSQRYY